MVWRIVMNVAPHMGAWIEIDKEDNWRIKDDVAPHMGAWIEMKLECQKGIVTCRRTPHGCVD